MRFEKWLSELCMKLGKVKKVLNFEDFRVRCENEFV
jgi:translation initiation factor IF-1